MRASLDGTSPVQLADGQDQPQGIAVDGNYGHWSILGGPGLAIFRANLVDGSNPQIFIASTLGAQLPAFTPPRLGFTPSP